MKKWLLISSSALAMLAATPAAADPITLGIALLSTTVTAVTAGAFVFGLTGVAGFLATFAVRAALGYALNSLAGGASAISRGYTVNTLGAVLPHQIIYGEAVVGGAVFYQAITGTSSEYLHRCVAYAGHEIDSYQVIYVNGEEVTLDASGNVTAPAKWVGLIRIKEHLGTATQAADSDLVSEVTEWTTAHQAKGIAYLYCRFKNASDFPNGVPTVTAKVRGRKVEDTRTSTTAWSDNPAMIVRDYVMADFGLNEASTDINDTLFEEAADVCDETVASADRYTCNGAFLLNASPEDIIRSLTSSMGGIFWYQSGQWAARAAKYVTPTITLDEHDLRSTVTIATRHSRRDNFNTVHGTYRGAETEHQEDDYTPVSRAEYVTEDNGLEVISDLPLLFTNTDIMAQRIASIYLRRNREQITFSAAFGLNAMQVRIGDTVYINNSRLGWTSKVFECVDWKFTVGRGADGEGGGLQINMVLRELSSSVFTEVGTADPMLLLENGDYLLLENGDKLILEAA